MTTKPDTPERPIKDYRLHITRDSGFSETFTGVDVNWHEGIGGALVVIDNDGDRRTTFAPGAWRKMEEVWDR